MSPSLALNSARARCNCALQVPTAMPSSCEASSCEWPYTPTSTSTCRAPGGSPAMAVSRSRLRPGSTVGVVGQDVGDLTLDRIPGAERLAPASRLLQHHVHRDPVQPRSERAARLEARQVAPRLHEGFLRAVFGRRDVAGHAQAQRVDARRMPAVELLEGHGRTVCRGRDQLALLGRLAHALQFIDDLPGVCQDPPRCYPSHRAAGSGILHRPPGGPCRAPVTDQMRLTARRFTPESPCLKRSVSKGMAPSAR